MSENGVDENFKNIVSKETFEVLERENAPVKISNIETAIIAALRLLNISNLDNISEIGGGLGEKILSASHDATTYEELVSLVSCKNYPEARVRRAILNILLGVTYDDLKAHPVYTTVLGFNEIGKEILSELRKKGKMPFITKPADAPQLERQTIIERRADSLFTLAMPTKKGSGEFIKKHPFIK